MPVVVTTELPVNATVGELPKSAPKLPDALVGPVLVMPAPAKTAKDLDVPSAMPACGAAKALVVSATVSAIESPREDAAIRAGTTLIS